MLIIPVSVKQLVKTPHGQACTRASRVIGRLPSVAICENCCRLGEAAARPRAHWCVNTSQRQATYRLCTRALHSGFHHNKFPVFRTLPLAFLSKHTASSFQHFTLPLSVHITTFPHTQNGYLHERRRTATTSSFEAAAGPPSTLRGDTFASLQLLRRTATAFPRGLRSRKRVETRGGDPHTRVLGRGRGRAESPREGQRCCMGGRDRDSGRSFSDPGNPPVRNEPNDHAGDANARMLAARLQCREHHEPQLLHFRRRVRAVSPHVHVAESELVARCGRRPRTF
jgi:hypothetical protein